MQDFEPIRWKNKEKKAKQHNGPQLLTARSLPVLCGLVPFDHHHHRHHHLQFSQVIDGIEIMIVLIILLFIVSLCSEKINVSAFFWKRKNAEEANAGSGECSANTSGPGCVEKMEKNKTVYMYNNGESFEEFRLTIQLSPQDCSFTGTEFSNLLCQRDLNQTESCTLHDDQGNLVHGCDDIHDEGMKLWWVPKSRLFMWPTFGIGHIAEVRDVPSPVAGEKIVLETISIEPKIFRVYNFFSPEETDEMIRNALDATDDQFRLKRSSTGAKGYNPDTFRTSENAFDTTSEVALRLKRRAFDLLGIFPYDETLADGLQILRYNQTTAYIDHMDWIEPMHGADHNFDSATEEGTNRYATILLYLSDVEDGGETLFSHASAESIAYLRDKDHAVTDKAIVDKDHDNNEEKNQVSSSQEKEQGAVENTTPPSLENVEAADNLIALDAHLEANNLTDLFPKGSWQRDLVGKCRSQLALKPRKAEAILFYSQTPWGDPDRSSLHAGCPVVKGEKWAANLWVWNGARHGYWKTNSLTGKSEKVSLASSTVRVTAIFSSEIVGAMLYWEDKFWSDLLPGEEEVVGSYVGHKWYQ